MPKEQVFGVISNFLNFMWKDVFIMKDFINIFDKDTVQSISSIVENKMYILNNIEDFHNKDLEYATELENLQNSLSIDLNNKLNNLIRISYQIEDYYFTLAYFLGKKHGEQSKDL